MHFASTRTLCVLVTDRGGTDMKIRAFVIEDDANIRDIVCTILTERGYEVHAFSEPLYCLIYLERGCPCPRKYACGDIFIVDLMMPNMTGLEFVENQTRNGCKAITQNKAVMSAGWTHALRAEARALGCKVFSKLSLVHELPEWLDTCEKRIDPNRKLADLQELFKQEHGDA